VKKDRARFGGVMKVLLFGATGMVGQGVLRECLLDPQSRYAAIELALTGFEACFFCLGVSSGGMKKEEYERRARSAFWRARISASLALGLRRRSDALRREGVSNAKLASFADALRRGDCRGRMFFQPISDAGGVACRYQYPG
jgi:hypothetical protein